MGLVSGIVVFLITWWVVLFAVLPWGVRTLQEDGDPAGEIAEGNAPSAPHRPRLTLKFLVTTGITAVIWLILFVVIESEVLSIRDWAESLPR